MSETKLIENRTYLLKTILVLCILFNLVRIDNLVYPSVDFQKHQPLSTTELVVQKIKTTAAGIYEVFSSPFIPVSLHDPCSESVHLNKYALLFYNDYQLIHYKSLENISSQYYSFNTIHKDILPHKSVDDELRLLNT